MNIVIGTVKTLNGQFFAKDTQGEIVELHVGDKITKDMVVYGADTNGAEANIKIGMINLSEAITLTGLEQQTFDMSLLEDNNLDDLISPNSLKAALKANVDVVDGGNTNKEDILDDTAAGEEVAVKGQSQADVFAARDGEEVDVNSTLRNAQFDSSKVEVTAKPDIFPEFVPSDETVVPPVDPISYNAIVTMKNVSVNEGTGTAIIEATIDNAPTDSDLVLLLDNGATITFAIGAIEATSTAFAIQDDDVYRDGEIIAVHANIQSGGNQFDNLDISDTANITVSDTTNTTTVNITADAEVSEGGTITYTATIAGTDAPQNDVVVTLSNGSSITISQGRLSGSVTVDAPADTVYEDTTTVDVTATVTATDGNYENLVVGEGSSTNPVSTTITDTPDTVTVNLSTTDVNEDDATVTFTANLTAPAGDEAVTVVTDQGTITIAAHESTGSITVNTQDSDVYLDASSITATITSVTGGDFESLVAGTNATAQIADTTDTTTLDLSATTVVNEGGVITYTATVDNAPKGNLSISLSNGQSIIIQDGKLTGSVTFTTEVDDDTDDEIIDVYVTNTSGGNYENLVVGDGSSVINPVTTTVYDGTNIIVTLTATENIEGVDPIIFTVTLTQESIGETTVHTTLGDIIIADGEISGTLEVVNPNSEDVYLDASSLENRITSVEGDDSLIPNTDTVRVEIVDTIDTTNATLTSAITGDENAATVTYTMTLDVAPTAEETFTFNVDGNPQTITVEAGQTTGATTVIINDPDVFTDTDAVGAPTDLTATNNSGYENLNPVNSATPHTATETIDTTTVTLSSTDVSEDDLNVTFTATLDHPTDTEMTITTTQGNIVIAAGSTTGTLLVNTKDSDVYLDADTITATITGTSGGNFEALDITTKGTTTANINDSIDTTTVTLSGTTSLIEGEVATYTVSIDNKPLEDMTVDITYSYVSAQTGDIVTNTEQVTILSGTNSVDFNVATFNDHIPEVNEIYNVTISNPSQGSFENVLIDNDTISTTIIDDDTAPVVSASSIVTSEDTPYIFTSSDFNATDDDGDALVSVSIDTIPDSQSGILYLDGVAVTAGNVVSIADINSGLLTFIPMSDSDIDSTFNFKAFDGTNWSDTSAVMSVAIVAVADLPTATISITDPVVTYVTQALAKTISTDIDTVLGDNVGDGNISGTENYDYGDTVTSMIDFGADYAGLTVSVEIDVSVSGTWNHDSSYFDDNWAVFINGSDIPEAIYKYNSNYNSSTDNVYITTKDDGVIEYKYGEDGTVNNSISIPTYKPTVLVTLDENGKAEIKFGAATTETSETVTINSYVASFNGSDDVPETFTYDVDITAALSDIDNSEVLSVLINNVPESGVLSSNIYTLNNLGSGTWEVVVPAGIKSVSDNTLTLTVNNGTPDFQLDIVATATEMNEGDFKEVTDSTETVHLIDPKYVGTYSESYDLNNEGWSNAGTENQSLFINNGQTASKTFNVNPGEEVTLTMSIDTQDTWESSDYFTISVNGNEEIKSYDDLQGQEYFSFNATADSVTGDLDVEIYVHTNKNNEEIRVDNFSITRDYNFNDSFDDTTGMFTITDNIEVDFNQLASRVNGLETINLNDTDAQEVTISLSDVLDMTDTGNTLIIEGTSGDELHVDATGWTQNSALDNGTSTTYEYSHDGSSDSITLTVDDQIDTTGM